MNENSGLEVSPTGRVTRRISEIGTASLRWCRTHNEPVWVYSSGSYTCPYDTIVETRSDDHALTDAPWEQS